MFLTKKSRDRGFTLIEIMVVMALIVILMSLAMFSLSSMNRSQLSERTYRNIKGAMENARLYSMSHKKSTIVGFSYDESKRQTVLISLIVKGKKGQARLDFSDGDNSAPEGFEWISKPVYLDEVGFSNDESADHQESFFGPNRVNVYAQAIRVSYGKKTFTPSHYLVFHSDGKTWVGREGSTAGVMMEFRKLQQSPEKGLMKFYWNGVVGRLEQEGL